MEQIALILDDKAMSRAIARISFEIIEKNKGVENLCIIGILSRGVQLAYRIADKIKAVEGKDVEIGFLDITPFRDDIKKDYNNRDNSKIDFDLSGKKVILVDDVIYTGRTARAAIDAIMARGRPELIQLAALVDRGHRELPIRADFIGKNVPTSKDEQVKVFVSERDGEDKVVILG